MTVHASGKRVFWHSSAHVLGEAAERHYGCHLCIGPPTDDGFFSEMAMDERCVLMQCPHISRSCSRRVVQSSDYPSLERLSDMAVKEKQKFERIMVSKEKLLEMFEVRVA